jgi:hypothetical protein
MPGSVGDLSSVNMDSERDSGRLLNFPKIRSYLIWTDPPYGSTPKELFYLPQNEVQN